MSDAVDEKDRDDEDEDEVAAKGFADAEAESAEMDLAVVDLAWLKRLRKITSVQHEREIPFDNAGVQIAYERMLISAFERMARICRNDLPPDEI